MFHDNKEYSRFGEGRNFVEIGDTVTSSYIPDFVVVNVARCLRSRKSVKNT